MADKPSGSAELATCLQSVPMWSRLEVQVEILRLRQAFIKGPCVDRPLFRRVVCYPRTTSGSSPEGSVLSKHHFQSHPGQKPWHFPTSLVL